MILHLVSGFGFRDSGFGIRDSGFGDLILEFVAVSKLSCRIPRPLPRLRRPLREHITCRFRDSGFGIRVSGFEFRVSGFRFRVSAFGCRFSGSGLRYKTWVIQMGGLAGAGAVHTVMRWTTFGFTWGVLGSYMEI